jgi:hypothetical protein
MSQGPRVKQGIQFIQTDQINGELRIVGEDDAASLLWAAQWLDEHREYIVTAMRFEQSADPDDEADLTATVVISVTHVGTAPDGKKLPGLLGPWPHGVPPVMPNLTRVGSNQCARRPFGGWIRGVREGRRVGARFCGLTAFRHDRSAGLRKADAAGVQVGEDGHDGLLRALPGRVEPQADPVSLPPQQGLQPVRRPPARPVHDAAPLPFPPLDGRSVRVQEHQVELGHRD